MGRHLGEEVVWYLSLDGAGRLRMPVSWTDLVSVEPDSESRRCDVSDGPFLWRDLVWLADLVAALCQEDLAAHGREILPPGESDLDEAALRQEEERP